MTYFSPTLDTDVCNFADDTLYACDEKLESSASSVINRFENNYEIK